MQEKMLKMKRVMCDFTIEQISDLLGVNRQTYRKKESGKKEFKASEISSLMEALKLTPDEVVDIFLH